MTLPIIFESRAVKAGIKVILMIIIPRVTLLMEHVCKSVAQITQDKNDIAWDLNGASSIVLTTSALPQGDSLALWSAREGPPSDLPLAEAFTVSDS